MSETGGRASADQLRRAQSAVVATGPTQAAAIRARPPLPPQLSFRLEQIHTSWHFAQQYPRSAAIWSPVPGGAAESSKESRVVHRWWALRGPQSLCLQRAAKVGLAFKHASERHTSCGRQFPGSMVQLCGAVPGLEHSLN